MGIKRQIKVLDILTNTATIYPSIKDASDHLNIERTQVNKCCRNMNKHPLRFRYKCSYIEKNS